MGKAKGKKGRRQQDSSDDDDFVDPIQAALAAGGGDDAAEQVHLWSHGDREEETLRRHARKLGEHQGHERGV